MKNLSILWEVEWDFEHGGYVPLKKRQKDTWQEQGLEGSLPLEMQKKGIENPKVFTDLPLFAFVSIY